MGGGGIGLMMFYSTETKCNLSELAAKHLPQISKQYYDEVNFLNHLVNTPLQQGSVVAYGFGQGNFNLKQFVEVLKPFLKEYLLNLKGHPSISIGGDSNYSIYLENDEVVFNKYTI